MFTDSLGPAEKFDYDRHFTKKQRERHPRAADGAAKQ